MTYGALKSLVKGLLIGDNTIPKEDDVVKALLSYAFNMIASKAEAMRLMTLDNSEDILRLSSGDYMVRKPKLPEADTDELDIDDELCFVAARYIASMISKDKIQLHKAEGDSMILDYNAKVYQVMENINTDEQGVLIATN